MILLRKIIFLLCFFLPVELIAKVAELGVRPGYTQIESTLAFPWVMFFVFLALILIPFILIVVLSWRKPHKNNP